jgi:aminoglycoside phosphotransferase (APT) family kinase protein
MQLHDVQRLAARLVPGRGEAEIRQVGTNPGVPSLPDAGSLNATYHVRRGRQAYAMRVRGASEPAPGADPVWECRVSQWAAAAQLAPPLIHCDPAQGVQITRWVDGLAPAAAQVREPASIAQVAALIRRIHAARSPESPRVVTPASWIAQYQEILQGGGEGSAAMRAKADAKLAALARLREAAPVLCHGDLHTGNLIETEGGLMALDWEYAHVSDPLWDLAGWSSANDFDGALRLALLEAYRGRAPAEDEQARLQLLAWLFDYVCLLWSEAYVARYPDHPADGIAARARQVSARL